MYRAKGLVFNINNKAFYTYWIGVYIEFIVIRNEERNIIVSALFIAGFQKDY